MIKMSIYYNDKLTVMCLPEIATAERKLYLPTAETGWEDTCEILTYCLDGRWYLKRPRSFKWDDEIQEPHDRLLLQGFNMALISDKRVIGVYCTEISLEETEFRVFALPKVLHIGKTMEHNELSIEDRFISEKHGEIFSVDSVCYFRDFSKNGTYLNKTILREAEVPLAIGDTLEWACGVVVLYLGDGIAVTSNHCVHHTLTPLRSRNCDDEIENRHTRNNFIVIERSPQFTEEVTPEKWSLELPPEENSNSKQPLLLALGPSLTMSVPMLLGSFIAGNNGYAKSGIIMMVTASALAVGWTLVNHFYSRNRDRRHQRDMLDDYVKRIQNTEEQLHSSIREMLARYGKLHPTAEECCLMIQNKTADVWGRRPSDAHFATVRIGKGVVNLPFEITVPALKMGETAEGIKAAPYALKNKFSQQYLGPIAVSLKSISVVGVVCAPDMLQCVHGMIVQLAVMHSATELKISIVTEEHHAVEWEWLRWLPHASVDIERNESFVGFTRLQGLSVLNHLNTLYLSRRDSVTETADDKTLVPHYILFCSDIQLIREHPLLSNVDKTAFGITVCLVSDDLTSLPNECKQIIDFRQNCLLDITHGHKNSFESECVSHKRQREIVRQLSAFREPQLNQNATIPSVVTLFESLGIRNIRQLDIWQQWNINSTGRDVTAIIGMQNGIQPFRLNLSDKFHGPHGLIAGTTGSGKSVLLQSLIMTLATRYHPYELQFVLIDYKGGGTFERLRELPHVVGMIDNLDGKRTINRALFAIRSEMIRRERLFKSLGVKDIHDYIARYNRRNGYQTLSHLILIIDEFSELREDMPAFLDTLNSTARIGRTLGMHMILATQKPAGAVTPEIWSNSRFRICLRVQTREDSMEMMHRPEASNLQGMGSGYVQVGNNEVFSRIQASWSDAPYHPDEPLYSELPHLFDMCGQPINGDSVSEEVTQTQLDELCIAIKEAFVQQRLKKPEKLWLDELPNVASLQELQTQYRMENERLQVPLGLIDDPQNQSRALMTLDFQKHPFVVVCGRAASGKTTFLQTLVYSIATNYSPTVLQVCIISLSGTLLHSLDAFPHVIDMTVGHETREQKRYVNHLQMELQRREALFAEMHTDNFNNYNAVCMERGEKPLAALVVVVDRIGQWYESLSDPQQEALTNIIKNAAGSGIYFVATAIDRSEIDHRLRDTAYYVALQQNALSDYSDMLECHIEAERPIPVTTPGRGMIRINNAAYEFQAALAFGEANDMRRANKLVAEAQLYANHQFDPVMTIPHPGASFSSKYLAQYNGECASLVPSALKERDAAPLVLDMYEKHMVFVYGKPGTGKTSTLASLARLNMATDHPVFVLSLNESWREWSMAQNGIWAKIGDKEAVERLASHLDDLFKLQVSERRRYASQIQNERAIAEKLPVLCIVLDDADKWLGRTDVKSAYGLTNQLDALLNAAFEKGHRYNIRIFIGCAASGISSVLPSATLNQIKDNAHGLALGATLVDCNPWGVYLPYSSSDQKMKAGEGFYISNEQPTRILLPIG